MDKNYKVWWYWNWKKKEISHNKSPISINNIDINKTVVSNKVSFSKSSFKSLQKWQILIQFTEMTNTTIVKCF